MHLAYNVHLAIPEKMTSTLVNQWSARAPMQLRDDVNLMSLVTRSAPPYVSRLCHWPLPRRGAS